MSWCRRVRKAWTARPAGHAGTGVVSPVILVRFFVRLEARFLVPARTSARAARAGRVKGGRRSGPPPGSRDSRPALGAVEPAANLEAAGIRGAVHPARSACGIYGNCRGRARRLSRALPHRSAERRTRSANATGAAPPLTSPRCRRGPEKRVEAQPLLGTDRIACHPALPRRRPRAMVTTRLWRAECADG